MCFDKRFYLILVPFGLYLVSFPKVSVFWIITVFSFRFFQIVPQSRRAEKNNLERSCQSWKNRFVFASHNEPELGIVSIRIAHPRRTKTDLLKTRASPNAIPRTPNEGQKCSPGASIRRQSWTNECDWKTYHDSFSAGSGTPSFSNHLPKIATL